MYKLNVSGVLPNTTVKVPCYDPQPDGSLKSNGQVIEFDSEGLSSEERGLVGAESSTFLTPAIGLIGYPGGAMKNSLISHGAPTHTINGNIYRISLIRNDYKADNNDYNVCGVYEN